MSWLGCRGGVGGGGSEREGGEEGREEEGAFGGAVWALAVLLYGRLAVVCMGGRECFVWEGGGGLYGGPAPAVICMEPLPPAVVCMGEGAVICARASASRKRGRSPIQITVGAPIQITAGHGQNGWESARGPCTKDWACLPIQITAICMGKGVVSRFVCRQRRGAVICMGKGGRGVPWEGGRGGGREGGGRGGSRLPRAGSPGGPRGKVAPAVLLKARDVADTVLARVPAADPPCRCRRPPRSRTSS